MVRVVQIDHLGRGLGRADVGVPGLRQQIAEQRDIAGLVVDDQNAGCQYVGRVDDHVNSSEEG